MNRILITGATGNIGVEVIRHLSKCNSKVEIVAAVRSINSAQQLFEDIEGLSYRYFDFENSSSHKEAFRNIDVLFLLRPPHISEIEKYFRPLLNVAKGLGILKVVFLSVQGAEKSKMIPHNKIEKLINELGFEYIFVRPSYFMQNITTTLLPEIQKRNSITLPSGGAKFNWVDVENIGEACAVLLTQFNKYKNHAYEITGLENRTFKNVVNTINETCGTQIKFKSVNPISFYLLKKREGMKKDFALVMTILHFLPRLQKESRISGDFKSITGNNPTKIIEFIKREAAKFEV